MSDISLRYEEREGIGKFLIGSVYSQSVSKDDTITVYKKDYMGIVLRIKTDAAVDVTLDSVAANLEVPEAGVDTFIDVNETIASFAGAGETVVNLADTLTKKWAAAFPYLRFKFSAAATLDFVVTAVADISSIVTASQNLTSIAGTALTGRDWSADFANLDVSLSTRAPKDEGATIKIASAADISAGVTAALNNFKRWTLFLHAAAAIDITVELSPDGGTTWFTIPESPISFSAAGDDVIEFGYDATNIRLTGSTTDAVTAIIRGVF